jgi:type IX secretion system PorP/SprF family membrane protein
MKKYLTIALCICSLQLIYSQEDDGVVSLTLPVRNSLTFNQYIVNPTFSFVRQQNLYISLQNKREWVQFEDAPETYMASFSGRFKENIGVGVGLFQQNYGVLTTFGGVLNFAYNLQVDRDSNLTFGMNVGAYKSGLNEGNVLTNFPDPSLNSIPTNTLLAITPGINFGTRFFDFGLAVNNLVLYNFKTSELSKEDPQQSIQAHIRYTGYMDSRGFFDQSKFSGQVTSQIRKDQTIVSGLAMLTIPKGIWAQVGYNNLYGVSAGMGLNITTQIGIEYNFERSISSISEFGPSHEITLAYKLKNKQNYYYSAEDEVSALIPETKRRKPVAKKPVTKKPVANPVVSTEVEDNKKVKEALEEDALIKAEEQVRLAEEARQKAQAEEQARLAEEAKKKAQDEEQARLAEEARQKVQAEERARLAEEAKKKAQEEEQARLVEEARQKAQAEEQARLAEEAKKKAQVEEQARLTEEARQKAQAEEQIRLAEEAKIQAEELAKIEEEAKVKAEEDRARLEEEARVQAAAEAAQVENAETPIKEDIPVANDALGKSLNALAKETDASKKVQEELISKLTEAIESKDMDLKDLKEENDLSDQGVFLEPKEFKSITAENKAIEAIKADLDAVIESRNDEIKELESLYNQREEIETIELDEVYLYYQKALSRLKSEQQVAIRTRATLLSRLETIKVATEFERNRRIKRALYNNEEDRYLQDRAALKIIKDNTQLSRTPLKIKDFNFGEERSGNIEILKNVNNVDNGYYLILAVHKDIVKRDEFITNTVAAGQKNVDFFYDVNTSKYYIYYAKHDDIQSANEALNTKGSRPYNVELSIVKIED